MASTIQIKTRAFSGAVGAPAALLRGELAVNFAGGKAGDTMPAVFIGDGTAVQTLLDQSKLSPSVTVGSATIPVVAPGSPNLVTDANAAAAWTVANGEVKVISHDGSAYVFTGGPGTYGTGNTPVTAGMFTSLGSATTAASAAEVKAGTSNTVFLTPQGLANVLPIPSLTAGVTGATPAGVAADADKIVTLNANGKIPTSLLSLAAFIFTSADLTTAAAGAALVPATAPAGTLVVHSGTAGAMDASWGAGTTVVQTGDMLLMDGSQQYHLIESVVDLSDAVSKTSANAATEAFTLAMDVPAAAGMVTRLDGTDAAKSQMSNFNLESCTLDGGTF